MDTVPLPVNLSANGPVEILWEIFATILHKATVVADKVTNCFHFLTTFVRVCWIGSKFPAFGRPLPLLGHLHELLLKEKQDLVNYCISGVRTTPVGVLGLGFYPIFFITDPRDIEIVASTSSCNGKPFQYDFLSHAIGQGILTLSGERWQSHRKIIDPSFHKKVIDSFFPCINKHVDLLIDHVLKNESDEENIEMFLPSQILFLHIHSEALLGCNFPSFLDPKCGVVQNIAKVGDCIFDRIIRPWLFPECIYLQTSLCQKEKAAAADFRMFTTNAIENRLKHLNSGLKTNLDPLGNKQRRLRFLDQLLYAEGLDKTLTMAEVDQEVVNVIFAGIDTNSIAFSFALYELSRHPEIQNRIIEELESLYDPSLSKIEVNATDINRMSYVEMVVKETLRLHNPVPISLRSLAEDVQLASCKLKLPAGAHLALAYMIPHMNPEYYPNPEEFNPENFLPEKEKLRHKYAFLPFSAGARSCIGKKMAMAELKAALAKVVWELELLPEPSYVPQLEWGLTLKPVNGVLLRTRVRRR